VEKLGDLFTDYQIILFYDESSDDTLDKLKAYQQINPKMQFYVNKTLVSKYRTHRLAFARNWCLEYIRRNCPLNEYPFFIMMDFDDVNCKEVNTDILKKYLFRNDWDALSFNTSPKYYDIWALSIYPYCFSYNHFKNTEIHDYGSLQNYIMNRLSVLKDGQLLRCMSSFDGFSIYRTNQFRNCLYDGRPRLDLIPSHYIKAHVNAAKSPLIFPDLGHIKALHEDCEHRAFHVEAINKNNAKIMIAKDVLFR
jgi:hypothetical protein